MTFKITLTGTGTPRPRPGRAGAGTLVEAGGTSLQFDAGRATALRLAEAGTGCSDLDALFLTHHHSDHVSSVDDLVITRWIERDVPPLTVVAPDGPLERFGNTVLDRWRDDIAVRRTVTGRSHPEVDWVAFTPSRSPSVVWEAGGVAIASVSVRHQPVEPAVAYRVDSDGMSVVVSGDTAVCEEVALLARGADVLVHEVIRPELMRAAGRAHVVAYHADAAELGAMAARVGVRTLVLTHLEPAPDSEEEEAQLAACVRSGGFGGELIVGRDLLVYDVEASEADPSRCQPLPAR